MGILDRFIKKEIIEVEKKVLADNITQEYHQNLLASATSYMKTKEEVIKDYTSKSKKVNTYADSVEKKTIYDWRSALISARDIKNPNRYWLQDLFAELRLDPFLDSVVTYQKNKLTHIKRYVEDQNGILDEKASKLFNSPWFDQVIGSYVEATLQGFDLSEIDKIIKRKGEFTIDRIEQIPPKNVIPEQQKIKKDAYSNTSGLIDYSNDDYLIEIIINNNRNLGILSKLAPYLIWKKLAMASWSSWVEDFSQPSMIIKSVIKNTDKEAELLASLEDIGSSLKMVLDQNDEFELVQPITNDVYLSFQQLISQVDDVISNEIVGGSLLFKNDGGGSYNLGSIHDSISQLKTLADLKDIEKYVNQFLITKLQRLGLLENKDYNFYFTPEEFLTLGARAEIDARLFPYIIPTKEYIEETYKVPVQDIKVGSKDKIYGEKEDDESTE